MSFLDALIEHELIMPPVLVGSPPVAGREIWIAIRTDGGTASPFGAGSQDDPYDGSTATKFDKIMRDIVPTGATVRLAAC